MLTLPAVIQVVNRIHVSMDGRKIANLLQEGYRMPKPQHLDYKLYVNMVFLLLVFGFTCLFVCVFF